MASNVYNSAKTGLTDGTINFLSDTIKAMLVTASYTPNPDHEFVSDVGNEISGTGYTSGFGNSGRKTLTGKAINKDNANDRAEFTFDAITWTSIDVATEPRYLILIKEITNDAASKIIACLDLGTVVTNGGNMTVTPNAEGAIQLS